MARQRATWVVTIMEPYSADETMYGPYTRNRAEQIETSLNRFFERGPQDNFGKPLVSAYPLQQASIPELKDQWSEFGRRS